MTLARVPGSMHLGSWGDGSGDWPGNANLGRDSLIGRKNWLDCSGRLARPSNVLTWATRDARTPGGHGGSNAVVGRSTAVAPLSTVSRAPVTAEAWLLARNATTEATSCGSAGLRSGTSA